MTVRPHGNECDQMTRFCFKCRYGYLKKRNYPIVKILNEPSKLKTTVIIYQSDEISSNLVTLDSKNKDLNGATTRLKLAIVCFFIST